MPQRQSIIQFESTEVQGEGSWIKVRLITHGESKQFQTEWSDVTSNGANTTPERRAAFAKASEDLLVKNVIDWNWVDDNGEPLPVPRDDPGVVDLLTNAEHLFIGERLNGTGERKK